MKFFKPVLIFALVFAFFSCEAVTNIAQATDDIKIVSQLAKEFELIFASGEDADNVKSDFTLPLSEVSGVTFSYSSSNPLALEIGQGKALVNRPSEADATARLTLEIKKGYATKTLFWDIQVLKTSYKTPTTLLELVTFEGKNSFDNIQSGFNCVTDMSAIGGGVYSGLNVTYNYDPKYLDVTNGVVKVAESLPRNSSYYTEFGVTFSSAEHPEEQVKKTTLVRISPLLPQSSEIRNEVTVFGKKLKLTYFDEFDNEEQLAKDWDIGNPGVKRTDIGNEGNHDNVAGVAQGVDTTDFDFRNVEYPKETAFDDGFLGYHHDRYKQPYWSPRAVKLKDGKLEIQVFWDKTVDNPSGDVSGAGKKTGEGYGLSGAIHSKRMFPRGIFVTKLKVDKRSASHWDAWWAESNNPYSNKCGYKRLYTPIENQGNESLKKPFAKRFSQISDVGGNRAPLEGRGFNGQQVYEYDMYEEVYENQTQWHVLHSWEWYGGHPGNTSGMNTGNGYFWTNSLRANDAKPGWKSGGESYSDTGVTKNKEWFYLVLSLTGDDSSEGTAQIRMNMYKTLGPNIFDGVKISERVRDFKELTNRDGHYRGWNIEQNPVQIKYSIEIGDWGNQHNLLYSARETLTPENPDIMYSDFFAFYAWEDADRDNWYASNFN